MKSSVATVILFVSLLAAACANPEPAGTENQPPPEPIQIPTIGSSAALPQLLMTSEGNLLFSWTARGESGIDLFVARREGGSFTSPVQVNTTPGSLNTVTIDEMRPALAAGPDGRVGIAWTDTNYDIQVAVSDDFGRSFGPSIRLNQDEGDALQEFPSIAFDDAGVLHAVWLDPRFAEDVVEEPADLYYARIENGTVREQNLTADQESTVCGCCLPDLQINGEDILITFRNTTPDGYRDPFQVHGKISGEFQPPTAVTAPVWQINACPVAGPIGVAGHVLWLDGSLGHRRLLESQGPGNAPRVVLEDSDEWFLDYPPRRIPGTEGDSLLLLVPSVPAKVLGRDGERWTVRAEDLPGWVTSAALVDGELVMVGSTGDNFVQDTRPWE